ncbi:MAG: 4-hydroxy-3-methylbut-2-enyl diphosphate reductase, partial [Clostridia bacterium]|nr:4-hydroxy-3-methylbut-2-enyl diphosphate reductase [Clostridia bacterium]
MIILAENAGFCFGVKRAVDAVENNIDKRLVTLGPLIHNKNVVDSLAKRGVKCIGSLDEILPGETVVIRSHGVPEQIYTRLHDNNIEYIDETCPHVKAIHERVLQAKQNETPVIIVGEIGHPEVIGILGWSGDRAYVVYEQDDIEKLPNLDKAVVVAQTTITQDKWDNITRALQVKIDELILFCSICSATRKRQDEAKRIAEKCDTVVVVGDKFSSNTRKLYELCLKFCKRVYYIEQKCELLLEIMSNGGIIGIVAGASTPDTIILEVYNYMSENEKVLPIDGEEVAVDTDAAIDAVEAESVETKVATKVQEETVPEPVQETIEAVEEVTEVADEAVEEVAEVADEAVEEVTEVADEVVAEVAEVADEAVEKVADVAENVTEVVADEAAEVVADEAAEEVVEEVAEEVTEEKAEPITEQDEFLEGLENVIRLKKGQLVKGNIVQITDTDICVNIGYKSDGLIHRSELSAKDEAIIDTFNEGDEIEAEVLSLNDGEGNVLLSRKRIERRQHWIKMKENVGTDKLYKCVIGKAVKGGVTTKIEGYSAFIPASHMSLKYIEDLKQFEGQEVEVTLIDADKRQ